MLTAQQVIDALGLLPHPEGGFFVETFRSKPLPSPLPGRGERSASTAIYFLLRSEDFSALHVVTSDEAWHHYAGDPLEIGFNAEFLREGLESVTSDEVRLKLINPLRPGLLSADGDAFWYLIMPIRLAG